MRDAVIVEAVRTPVGKRKGALADTHPADLSGHVLQELVARAGIDAALIDDVIWGCVVQVGEQAGDIARTAALSAGFPESVPGVTIDRQCGSSQQAVHFGAAGVIAGHYDFVAVGGVESMTRLGMGISTSIGGDPWGGERWQERYGKSAHQGLGAEAIAKQWNLSRARLDEYSLRSHELAAAAQDSGAFEGQIAPVKTSNGVFSADEGIRRGGTLEGLAKLKPAFAEDGVIHAGNASQISDGAAALLITTSELAQAHGLKPIARVHSVAVVGSEPMIMLTGPIPATAAVLKRSGLTIDEIGAFEVNEAFASVPLAWQAETGADEKRLNPVGGAIALGHPLGGSGARISTTLIHHMRDNGVRYGLQTMCEGGGQANATIFELL